MSLPGKTVDTTYSSNLTELLEISVGSIVAVIGCGGKTTLINHLAANNRELKVLISPTTKTFPVISDDVTLCDTLESCINHKPQTGIQCLGQYNQRNGKLEALPEKMLADMVKNYDIVLMEADGSRYRSCKGWRENEPVVPQDSTHTIGVVTLDALGKAATDELVHHLPEFLSLTGLTEGEAITAQALEDMVCLPGGMFKNPVGESCLLVNKAEDDKTVKAAESFLHGIKSKYPGRFKRLIYGSVHKDTWTAV